jgi:hypothetical protein
MSGPKISELPAVVGRVPLASQFPLNDGGATRTATLPQLWRTRHPGYRAGLHYVINGGAAATGGVAEIAAADTLYLGAPLVPDSAAVPGTGLSIRTNPGGAAGSVIKAALFLLDETVGQPRGLPVAFSAITYASTATGLVEALFSADFAPDPRLIYVPAIVCNATTPRPTTVNWINTSQEFVRMTGVGIGASAGATQQGWSIACAIGTDLATFDITGGLGTVFATIPVMHVRT